MLVETPSWADSFIFCSSTAGDSPPHNSIHWRVSSCVDANEEATVFRFLMAEMKACRRQWIAVGVFVMIAVCMLSLSVGFIAAGAPYAADTVDLGLRDVGEEYISLGGMQTAFTVFAMLAIVPAVVNTCISMDSRRLAKWQLAGASVRQSQWFYWLTLLVDSVVASAIGGVVAIVLWRPYANWALRVKFPDVARMHGALWGGAVPIGIASGIMVTALAGLFGLRSISRVDVITAARSTGLAQRTRHPLRNLLGIAVLAGVIAGYIGVSKQPTNLKPETLSGMLAAYWGAALGLALVLALCDSWITPLTVRLVSHVLPQTVRLDDFLAAGSANRHVRMSTSMVTPLCVATITVGSIMGMVRQTKNVALAQGVRVEQLEVSPGGQIIFEFITPVLLALVAVCCLVVITGEQRNFDTALLLIAGVPRHTIIGSAIAEAFLYTLTAAVLSLAALLLNAVVIGAALNAGPVPGAGFAGLDGTAFAILAASFVVLALLLVSTLSSQSRHNPLVTLHSATLS